MGNESEKAMGNESEKAKGNESEKAKSGEGKLGAQDLRVVDAVGLSELPTGRPLLAKMGFDPTAPDLHLGHAVGLFALRRFQDMGHKVALVVGDFTAAIGDPTGRNDTRPKLAREQIVKNAKTYAEQAMRILDPAKTEVVYNSAWLEPLGAAGMVELASKATVAQMLAREDFKKRFEENAPIGAHELLYPLLQARDSVELRPDVEFGGTDQRFNLLMGRELMREAGMAPQACAMVPLLVGLDGVRKMSKSLGNHIGLTEAPEEIFAKAMSISDEAMAAWRQTLGAQETELAGEPMESKKRLAGWIVGKLSGPQAAAKARESWEATRQRGQWSEAAEELRVELPAEGKPWAALLREWGWEGSGAMARERIKQGALKLDGEKISDPQARATPGMKGLLRYGPRKAARLEAIEAPSADAGASAAAVKAPRP